MSPKMNPFVVRLAPAVLAVAGLVTASALFGQDRQPADPASARPQTAGPSPSYKGRVLELWLSELGDRDSETASEAVRAVGKIGMPARDALLEALESPDPVVRRNAALAVHSIEPMWKDALERLIARAGDSEASVRETAIDVLAAMAGRVGTSDDDAGARATDGDDDAEFLDLRVTEDEPTTPLLSPEQVSRIVDALAAALGDRSAKVRYRAVTGLARLGPGAAAAVEPLVRRLEDPQAGIRFQAASALSRIGTERALAAVPIDFVVDVAMRARSSSDRREAVTILGRLVTRADEVVPRLIAVLESPGVDDRRVLESAADALAGFGPAARDAIPALRERVGRAGTRVVRTTRRTNPFADAIRKIEGGEDKDDKDKDRND